MVALKVGSLLVTADMLPSGEGAQWRVYEDEQDSFGRMIAGGTATRIDLADKAGTSACLVDALQNAVAEARRLQDDEGLPIVAWEDAVFGWSGVRE